MDAVVDATGLAKRFGATVALDGVDLTIERGEIYGLIGPNGAGKTTLARVLLGTLAPDAGEVRLFGQSPDAIDPARIGYLPQSFDPHDRLTPAELLAYYGGLYDDARPIEDVLATVGIDPETETRYADLSGGERRRVCVATALVNDPDLLVVDEPTTGIDPAGRRALRDVFTDLRDAGTTVLLSTHDMSEAEAVADRVGMLAEGRLVAEDAPGALVAAHGGQSRLTIQTDAPPDALDHVGVERTDDGLAVPAVDPTTIGAIVDRIDDAYRVDGLTWTDPDLEDVYLSLAAAAQRDDRDSPSSGDATDSPPSGDAVDPLPSGEATGAGPSGDATEPTDGGRSR